MWVGLEENVGPKKLKERIPNVYLTICDKYCITFYFDIDIRIIKVSQCLSEGCSDKIFLFRFNIDNQFIALTF